MVPLMPWNGRSRLAAPQPVCLLRLPAISGADLLFIEPVVDRCAPDLPMQGQEAAAEAEWNFACTSITTGCSKYQDQDWLQRIRCVAGCIRVF